MTHRYFKNPLLTFAISLLLAGSVLGQFERPVIREIRIRGNEITEESLIRFQCGLEEGTRLQPDDPGTAIPVNSYPSWPLIWKPCMNAACVPPHITRTKPNAIAHLFITCIICFL